jgi:hypothetical protein
MNALTIISQSIAAGGLAGARPALTLALLLAWSRFVQKATLPEGMDWLHDEIVLGVIATLAVVEHFVRTDPDFEELMRIPNALVGIAVAMLGALLLGGMGDDPERWKEVAVMHAAGAGVGVTGSAVLLSAVASGLLWRVRAWMFEVVADFGFLHGWWRWIEAGGVVGLMVLLLSLPVLSIGVAIGLVGGSAAAGAVVLSVQKKRDAAARRDCPTPDCQYKVRKEALLCPACHAELTPEKKAA